MKCSLVAALVVTLPLALFSQEFRGTISGAVTDATGASVAGAKITVTETHTNVKTQAASESTGQYTVPFLMAGDYDVAAQMRGFKEFIRKGVHLGAGEHPTIDIALQIGDANQSVEVTAEVPLILYTVVLYVPNIVAGFDSVPLDVLDAADGMGYTRGERWWRVELPLAVPLVVAGLRLASVSTIGLVTVSAILGDSFGGLGYYILDGYERHFTTAAQPNGTASVALPRPE